MEITMPRLTTFLADERGAITVDWVVLTAAMVGLGLAVLAVVNGGLSTASTETADEIASIDPGELAFGEALAFTRQQWDARNPGVYDSYSTWMAGFTDEGLMNHYANMAQYANTTNTGHPYDTYHDEFWIARDEAIVRGLVDPGDPIPDAG